VQTPLTRPTIVVLGCATVYMAAAILFVSPLEAPEYHFVHERGAVTALSAILLAMSSGFALSSLLLSGGARLETRIFWSLIAAGMAVLAVDELMELHEKIGGRLDEIDALGIASAGALRGWNDLIVILYGVAALPFVLTFLPSVLRYPRLLELLGAAFVFFVIHTSIDSLVEPRTTISAITEEAAKIYCACFLALAFLSTLLVIARNPGLQRG